MHSCVQVLNAEFNEGSGMSLEALEAALMRDPLDLLVGATRA
jgi:hypothetical protein